MNPEQKLLKRTVIVLGLGFFTLTSSASAEMALNPDVTPRRIANTICVPGYTKSVRPSTSYTNGVKRKLLREAGRSEARMADYELDHIIPLALGGHPRSLRNLMLQPWDGPTGAKKKDRLEVNCSVWCAADSSAYQKRKRPFIPTGQRRITRMRR